MPGLPTVSVCVRDLARRYGAVEALRGISFEVNRGEIFGLLGPNGAGKTTALECLLGLRRPDAGSIAIAGVDAIARPEAARRLCGALIQGATLQDKISPRRVLQLFASFYREPEGIDELIERFGLSAQAKAPFESLSAGQRQRLFLALAFVNRPSLLVLDEPTAGLDPKSRRELHALIAGMRETGRTVLLSTHDLEEAHRLCDRVGILDGGRIIAAARPGDLIAASPARSRVGAKTAKPVDRARWEGLPGVTGCLPQDGGWRFETDRVHATVAALVRILEADGNELLDLQVTPPSLEDAFLALTGRPWSAPAKEEA